jgi:hypothetical protein
LCGVLSTIAFVRGVTAARSASSRSRHSGGSSGTNTGRASARIASGP